MSINLVDEYKKRLVGLQDTLSGFFDATPVGQVFTNVKKSTPIIQKGIQNFAQNNLSTSGTLLGAEPSYNAAQSAIDKGLSYRMQLPKINTGNSIANTVLNTGSQLAFDSLVPVNPLLGTLQAAYKLPQAKSRQEAAGYGAQATNSVMMAATPKSAIKTLDALTSQPKYLNPLQKIGSSVMEGLSTGAQYGTLGGTLSGIEQGKNMESLKDYYMNILSNAAVGGVSGAAVGGAIGGIGSVGRQTIEAIQGKARTMAQEQVKAIFAKDKKYWPKFAKDLGGDQQKIEDFLYKYYKTQLGQSGAVDFNAKIGLPESAGQITPGQSATTENADLPNIQSIQPTEKQLAVSLPEGSSKKSVAQTLPKNSPFNGLREEVYQAIRKGRDPVMAAYEYRSNKGLMLSDRNLDANVADVQMYVKKLQAQETQPQQTKIPQAQLQDKKIPQELPKTRLEQASIMDNSQGLASRKTLNQSISPTDTGINVSRMGITKESKDLVNKSYDDIKPQIEKVVGKKLGLKEVEQIARSTKESLSKVITREETERLGAQALNLRSKLAELSDRGIADEEFINTLIKDKAFGAHIARLLGQRRIVSNSEEGRLVNRIVAAVLKQNQNVDEILTAAKGVNFKDAKQATEFYRKFVAPKVPEWIDMLRYNSMLSSPNTMINNAASNLQGTGIITPIEKTITGGVDFLRHAVTGQPRKYRVGEGAVYAAGYWSNVGNAAKKFLNVMSGKSLSDMQELHNIPLYTKGPLKHAEGILKVPTKVLQATDEFFQTLTEAGSKKALAYRQAGGISVDNLENKAFLEGRKRLFNADSNLPEEGYVLKALEYIPSVVLRAKSSNNPVVSLIAKFTFPFVKVPANIMKQSIEYSPLGLTTLWGAKNKEEQLAKTILGSSVGLTAAMLVSTDRMTWAEPTSEKQKAAFRAAGMQPYAIKAGDNWYNYSKLHPSISFPLALVAATRNAEQNKSLDDGQVEVVLNGVAQWLNFFADQSYVKNIGDFVNAAKGDVSGISRFVSNYPQQLIPFRSLLGWINRITDPVQRRADPNGSVLQKQLQTIAMSIPGFSKLVPARTDSQGNEIKNTNAIINAISPIKITTENSKFKNEYNQLKNDAKENKLNIQYKDKLENSKDTQIESPSKIYFKGSDGKIKTFDKQQPQAPVKTGNIAVDQVLYKQYSSDLSNHINNLIDLYRSNGINKEEASKQLQKLELERYKAAISSGSTSATKPRTLSELINARELSDLSSKESQSIRSFKAGDTTPSQLESQLKEIKKLKLKYPKQKAIKIKSFKAKKIKVKTSKKVKRIKIKKSKAAL